ncbi:hypothetical protein HOR30_gp19 [Klebsiella phage KP-Rio/2015]|uniref:Uncharacterized protein n=1 Tax=Klebsiella phage KP-Rio/2015 TaxID=1904925 RepID=A0A1D8ES49_9CAUD|nr:hypothetical protein HOR30_gp19 [Klebsiella phage KP-Rio/2015]AOT23858.1 hypothetical protein KPRIO2015_19 [Klebsiella phage KP-Rio/2015]
MFCTGSYLCNPETDWRYRLVLVVGTASVLRRGSFAVGNPGGRRCGGSRGCRH